LRIVGRVALGAALAALAAFAQQPVHRGLGAQVDALVQQDRPHLANGLVGEPRRIQHRQHLLALLGRQLGRVMERPARPENRRAGITVPVHRGPRLPQDRARPDRADRILQGREVFVEDPVQLSSESALLEMS
jgi:hypothetical protein